MSCDNVQELISPLLDRRIPADEREKVLAHLEVCRKCDEYLEAIQNQRKALLRMDPAPVPEAVAARLRVMASHERARQLAHASFSSRIGYWYSRTQLLFDNMMRPLALPVAGGLLSAMVMFSVLVPSLSFEHVAEQAMFAYPDGQVVVDASTGTYTPDIDKENTPRLVRVDMVIPEDANAVTLTVDENGNVCDYAVARGQLTQDLKSIIMFSKFRPATFLGVPIPSKVNAVQRPVGVGRASRTIRS
ncbi:MAG TPA: anti-sigma factor [Bryobacteraceae bacterium]|jgi:hypothetical protein